MSSAVVVSFKPPSLQSGDLHHLDIVTGGPALGIHLLSHSRGIVSFLRACLVLRHPVRLLPVTLSAMPCAVTALCVQQLDRSLACRFLWPGLGALHALFNASDTPRRSRPLYHVRKLGPSDTHPLCGCAASSRENPGAPHVPTAPTTVQLRVPWSRGTAGLHACDE